LDAISKYLDSINPLVKTAQQTAYQVVNAADDEKLNVFEDSFMTLCDKLGTWVREGFRMFLERERDPSIAEQRLREFLEPRLGHQMKHPIESYDDDVPMPIWFREPAHKSVIWWVGASVGESEVFFGWPGEADPHDAPETDAEMLAEVDAALAEQWLPPAWLWRISRILGEVTAPKAHSKETARIELAYVHWQLWEAIEDAIDAADLYAEAVTEVPGSSVTTKAKRARKRAKFNPEYQVTYQIVKDLGSILEGRAKLAHDFLNPVCAEHDRRRIPIPKDCDWKAKTWSLALEKDFKRVKGWIEHAVARHHNALMASRSRQ
jgi:hypothetical protein